MTMTLDGTSGMTAPTGAVYNGLQTASAQTSTSGTSVDFLSIPLWAKRVTVLLSGVSTNGNSALQIQLGSGSYTTSGYAGSATFLNGSTTGISGLIASSGLSLSMSTTDGATAVRYGAIIFANISGNTWLGSGTCTLGNVTAGCYTNASVSLSGTLDRIRLTTINGTDTFDAGTVNIIYE